MILPYTISFSGGCTFLKIYECIILPSHPVLGCSSTNCNQVLTDAQGEITSPCYPQKYPNSQICAWTMQAPAGFIIQLTFLDFDLEEAPGCIYDRVVVNTGNIDVPFCGLTANGLTLNSTGNVMELSFTSDFSVQKKGFNVSFRHGRSRLTPALQVWYLLTVLSAKTFPHVRKADQLKRIRSQPTRK